MTSTTMISFRPKAVTVAVLALGLGLAACKTTPPPKPTAAQLTGEQLHALYMSGTEAVSNGKSFKNDVDWHVTFDGKGGQTLLNKTNGYTDTGTYRIDGNKFCSKWDNLRNGRELCNPIYEGPNGSYEGYDDQGNVSHRFIVTKTS